MCFLPAVFIEMFCLQYLLFQMAHHKRVYNKQETERSGVVNFRQNNQHINFAVDFAATWVIDHFPIEPTVFYEVTKVEILLGL